MFFLPVWKTLLLVLNIFFIEEQTDISSFALVSAHLRHLALMLHMKTVDTADRNPIKCNLGS